MGGGGDDRVGVGVGKLPVKLPVTLDVNPDRLDKTIPCGRRDHAALCVTYTYPVAEWQ